MNNKKKISNGSQPTQTQRSKRFIRRNSVHTLHCRSGSLKKICNTSQILITTSHNIINQVPNPTPIKPNKLQVQTQNFFRQFSQPYEISLKRGSGSMKIDSSCRQKKCQIQKYQTIHKQLTIKQHEVELLQSQCKRLKNYVNQQRQKRKTLEQEVRCNQQEIRRLEKRLQKYRIQKQKFQRQRNIIVTHIEQLESLKLNPQTQKSNGYRQKIMELQVVRLREQLQKGKGSREKELTKQVQKLIQSKYNLQNLLKSANIANSVLTKQLEDAEHQMQEIRLSIHRTVTSSYQYVQLRQRYRRMLIEFKQLREEMSILQQKGINNHNHQNTLLTVSESGDALYLE